MVSVAAQIVQLVQRFADGINDNPIGRRFAGAFDAAIQFRWVPEPVDPSDMGWFGTDKGSWACLETKDGRISVLQGDRRKEHDWRRCILIETDEATLREVLEGAIRPLDAYLGDRLHVSHFTVGGAAGQWALALLTYGQRSPAARGLLPGRDEKRFMTYDYHGAAEKRREELLAWIQPKRG